MGPQGWMSQHQARRSAAIRGTARALVVLEGATKSVTVCFNKLSVSTGVDQKVAKRTKPGLREHQ